MKSILLSVMLACASKTPTTTQSNNPSVVPAAETTAHEGPQKTVGITGVEILGMIDLQLEFDGFEEQVVMRARRLEISETGVVAAHEHQSRPGVAFMLAGAMTEFRDGKEILRKKGELSFERTGVKHWWKNLSGAPASALVVDILTPADPATIPSHTAKASPQNAEAQNTGLTIVKKDELPLTEEHPVLQQKKLRARVIDIAPGGTVGLHLHQGRPGFAYVLDGTLTEHRNDQVEPHQHQAGDLVVERNGVEHWWKNVSAAPARVLVIDLISAS